MAEETPVAGPGWRRWVGTLLIAGMVSAACVVAGVWQWHRHEQRSAAASLVADNYDAAPVPADELLEPGRPVAEEHLWRPVAARGRYLTEGQVLLRNRPVDSQPAYHVLVPFLVEEGPLADEVLLVARGWVPTGDDGGQARTPGAPPQGTVDLVVRLRAEEPPSARDAPAGQAQAIALDQVRASSGADEWTDEATLGAYGVLVSEDGSRPTGLGRLPRPDTGVGTNLSYAFQWWVFAVGAVVGCVVLIRRDTRELGDGSPGPAGRAATGDAPRRRRRVSAEDEEDGLIDAQLEIAHRDGARRPTA